jgi:hypothetical protein
VRNRDSLITGLSPPGNSYILSLPALAFSLAYSGHWLSSDYLSPDRLSRGMGAFVLGPATAKNIF